MKDLSTSQAFLVSIAVLALGFGVKIVWASAPYAEMAVGIGGLFATFALKKNAKEKREFKANGNAAEKNGDA